MTDAPESIVVTDDGLGLPVAEVLTGRGFITGKSGSGKSNSASVVAEELLEAGLPLLIVDTDGEYFGLQDRYQILHATVDDSGDMTVGPDDAERLAGLAIDGNVPIVLDISGYVEPDEGTELVHRTLRELFRMEDARRKPFLIVVEEIHEYLPERGAHGKLGDLLIQIAKRGRKRGLGLCGISQRPAAVSKDFITQCDWLLWHRLTWENDLRVVRKILGSDAAEDIGDLNDGEAFLMTDWDDEVRRVKFKRKRTLDAGATPNIDAVAGGPNTTLDDEVLEALDIDEQPDSDLNATADTPPDPRDQEITRLHRRVEELEAALERAKAETTEPPQPSEPANAGAIARGLSELGSLAVHTVKAVSRRVSTAWHSAANRLRSPRG